MEKFRIGEPVDAAAELEELLKYNGFAFRREGGRFRVVFADRGRKWETVCVPRDGAVLIYGRYPFPIADEERARRACEEVNRQVMFGGMFILEGHVVFRTGADLFDDYSAYEHIGRALEYNAGVIVRFWEDISAGAR